MNVCQPQLLWLNGSCYRINGQEGSSAERDKVDFYSGDVADEYEDEIGCAMEDTPEINDCQYAIEETNSGRFTASFHIASAFFGMIIGKSGTTRKRIESETQSRINVPKQGVEDQDIQISGDTKFAVAMACNRIDAIVSSARQRQGFTHFISVPCNSKEMQTSYKDFQNNVMESCGSDTRGLDETVFQTPSLLHLTIGTLALMDEMERKKAKEILEAAIEEFKAENKITTCPPGFSDPRTMAVKLNIEIKDLEIMNDDPGEVDVVYAKVNDCDELQKLADGIVSKFTETGLMPRQFDRVKLHMTVLNTIFRKEDSDFQEEKSEQQQRETLDARSLLKHYGDFHFGSMDLKEIHLSQRRVGKRSKENYYFPSAVVCL